MRLEAGRSLTFPDANAPFQIRLQDPGKERLIAMCHTERTHIPGLDYTFSATRSFAAQGREDNMNRILSRAMKVVRREKQPVKPTPAQIAGQFKKPEKRQLLRKAITLTVH